LTAGKTPARLKSNGGHRAFPAAFIFMKKRFLLNGMLSNPESDMPTSVYKRDIVQQLRQRLAEPRRFIQVIIGPRQVGKTTAVHQAVEEWNGRAVCRNGMDRRCGVGPRVRNGLC